MIKVLDKVISDKIAAGEVIERPVSIVKELIENSIDAGSDKITIEIENGGKTYIRVTDNGIGLPKEEVETAFLRHATSKILTAKDLDGINTLGFRGEALSSIASVTRTEIITKTRDEKTAKKVEIHGGNIINSYDIGSEDGTTIIVKDLFYNTPARQKFLKQDNVESTKIIDLLSEFALCYSNIKFRFINNHQVVFSTPGDNDRLSVIMRIYGSINTNNLVPVLYSDNGIKISGYISNPQMSRTTRKDQIFFVNGRVVDSKVIDRGIALGYKERLFEGRYPICYLFLDVNPNTIDVNIHPNKREVRFNNESLISQLVCTAINESLKTKDAIPDISNLFKDNKITEVKENNEQVDIKTLLSNKPNNYVANEDIIKYDKPNINSSSSSDIKSYYEEQIPIQNREIVINEVSLKPFDFNELKIKGIIFNTYIECVDDNSFYLIDQHAAQERVFYEKLVSNYDSTDKNRQSLLCPLVINVSINSNEDKNNWLCELENMGFTISEFGNNSYRVTEIPMFMELGESEEFINSFINSIDTSIDLRNIVVVNKLIMMSCKAAIKANDKISIEEAEALLKDLKNCKNPYSCPHGRPTVIKFSRYEIEKMFKRV